jgi:hypothetical protein
VAAGERAAIITGRASRTEATGGRIVAVRGREDESRTIQLLSQANYLFRNSRFFGMLSGFPAQKESLPHY